MFIILWQRGRITCCHQMYILQPEVSSNNFPCNSLNTFQHIKMLVHLLLVVLTLKHEIINQTNQNYEKYSTW